MSSAAPAIVGTTVADGVGRIPGFVNCYTLSDGDDLTLIDTGLSRGARKVIRAFDAAGLGLTRLSRIVLTHHHIDHRGGAAVLLERAHTAMSCHGADADVVEGRAHAYLPLLARLFMRPRPATVAHRLVDGDMVGKLHVIHLPGHTAGEIALYEPRRKLLFAGDSLDERRGRLGLPGAHIAVDIRQAVESLKRLENLEIALMFPGHGEPVGADFHAQLAELIRRAPQEYF
ncbi:MAG TPA: MBL fold metallo-hydrolase [Thermoplasmata archaeon]|nr:MBL fold metallo-hydrolase [Thermoplasmata archaeon]